MVSILKSIGNFITYDARLDPEVIPAKLDLGSMGRVPYEVKYVQPDGSYGTIKPSDPNRTFRFVRADDGPAASKWFDSVLPRRTCAIMGALYAVLGAVTGACLATGLYPAAIVTAAILCVALYTVGSTPKPGDDTPHIPYLKNATA